MAYTQAQLRTALENARAAGDDAAVAYLSQHIAAQASPAETYDPTAGMSTAGKLAAGAGKAVVDTGRGIGQLLGLVSDEQIAEARRLDQALMNTGAGQVGNVLGHVGTALMPGGVVGIAGKLAGSARAAQAGRGLMAPTTIPGAMAAGGTYAGIQPGSLEERAQSAGLGALGSGAGQALGQGISHLARARAPTRAAQTLQAEGVPVSPSQEVDSRVLRRIEDVFDHMPSTGGKQQVWREGQQEAFNRAVLKRAGVDSGKATHEVMDQAYTQVGQKFEDVIRGRQIKLGDEFLDDVVRVEQSELRLFPSSRSRIVNNLIDDALDLAADPKPVDAILLHSERSKIAKMAADAHRANNHVLGDSYYALVDALDNAILKDLPKRERESYMRAMEQFRILKLLEKTGLRDGNVSPAKLASAMHTSNRRASNVGADPVARLAQAGRDAIKPGPDSGTAQRMMYQNMMTGGAIGGGAGAYGLTTGDWGNAAQMAALGLGGPYATRAMMHSPQFRNLLVQGMPGLRNPAVQAGMRAAGTYGPAAGLSTYREDDNE